MARRTHGGTACAIRTQDGDGPWTPCPRPAVMPDPDGDWLCEAHLNQMWTCPDCGGWNPQGNGMPCPACQGDGTTRDDGLWW
jgi:hypothetical protein